MVWVDTGIAYHGYASDFGRTWVVGREPSAEQRQQFRDWRDVVHRVLDEVRPGATGADLTRAACSATGPDGRRPWLPHLYLAHGVGTDSAEMPLIGTDLGVEFDASIVLVPGMVLVLEPVIVGGRTRGVPGRGDRGRDGLGLDDAQRSPLPAL